MDEAGYGPNLGPLVVTVTRWTTPGSPDECEFYELLRDAIAVDGHADWSRLHVADSKQVYTGNHGFESLETSALALLRCLGDSPATFLQLWQQLDPDFEAQSAFRPEWYAADLELPLRACPKKIDALASQLRDCLCDCRMSLDAIHSDIVVEPRFNQLTSEYNSKGLALSRIGFRLLRRAWGPEHSEAVLIIGDKHGGRNRYDDLLAEVLDGEMIFRVEESRSISRYRVNRTEFRFQVGGEEHLPVAAASIISKYVRELAMEQLNRFWNQYCPDVRPTKGYPNDARRFREEIQAAVTKLQIDELRYWRMR